LVRDVEGDEDVPVPSGHSKNKNKMKLLEGETAYKINESESLLT
jgi:hypothetical protein